MLQLKFYKYRQLFIKTVEYFQDMREWKPVPCQLLFKIGDIRLFQCVPPVWEYLLVADADTPIRIQPRIYKGLWLQVPYRQTHTNPIQDL